MPVEIDSDSQLIREEFKKKIQDKYLEITTVYDIFLKFFLKKTNF